MALSVKLSAKVKYENHFEWVSSQICAVDTINEMRSMVYDLTRTKSLQAYECFRTQSSPVFQNELLAGLEVVNRLGNFDSCGVLSWKLIHVACFLISKEGTCYISGLQRAELTDYRRKAANLEEFFKCVLKDSRGPNKDQQIRNLSVAVELLQDIMIAKRMKETVESTRGIENHSNLFTAVLQSLLSGVTHQPRVSMQFPNGDLTQIKSRLVTFLKYPPHTPIGVKKLAKLGFVSTCRRDEIQCIECHKKSDQLTTKCDPTSLDFHSAGCSTIREARLSFRIASFKRFPHPVPVVYLAQNGLFFTNIDNDVRCFRCLKQSAIDGSSGDFPNNLHQGHCNFIPETVSDADYQEHLEIISRKRCLRCNDRPATLMAIRCCHLILCKRCYRNLDQPPRHCLFCQGAVEKIHCLYEVQ